MVLAASAISNYYDSPEEEIQDETALRIIKLEEGTETVLDSFCTLREP